MTTVADLPQDLIDRVRTLSAAQKDALRGVMDAETPAAGDPELKAKLTRRWEDYTSGKVQAIPIEEAKAQLRTFVENLPK